MRALRLITVMFAILAAVGCQSREDLVLPERDVTVRLSVAPPTKATDVDGEDSKINSLQCIVFERTTGNKVTYVSHDGSSGLTVNVKSGDYRFYVLANAPSVSSLTTESSLLAANLTLTDNSLNGLVAIGYRDLVVTEPTDISLALSRIPCKVVVRKITNQYNRNIKVNAVYLTNVCGKATYSGSMVDDVWYNKMGYDSGISSAVKTLIYENEAVTTIAPSDFDNNPKYLYAMPNSTVDDTFGGTWCARKTRIVIDANVGDEVDHCYYVIPLTELLANNRYLVDITIQRHGSDDEESVAQAVAFNVTVTPWGVDYDEYDFSGNVDINALKFKAASSQTIYFDYGSSDYDPQIEYSFDGRTWIASSAHSFSQTFGVSGKDSILIRGTNPAGWTKPGNATPTRFMFGNSTPVECSGNIMSLINYKDKTLVEIPCADCFKSLFANSAVLTGGPSLPATVLTSGCYQSMFLYCSKLATAPELPATTLADNCYNNMFGGCHVLTQAPELPATTLASYCYYGMFSQCLALEEAPELPATTLVQGCYNAMFYYTPKLCDIRIKATDVSASGCLTSWLAYSGTSANNPMLYVPVSISTNSTLRNSRGIFTIDYVAGGETDLSKRDVMGNTLSTRSTANCYVVRSTGKYKIPLVYGNGIAEGAVNSAAYTNNGGTYSADFVNHNGNAISSPYIEQNTGCTAKNGSLVWMTGTELISCVNVIDGADCRYLHFYVKEIPSTNGLAVISVRDASNSNNIMWSWTIWLTTDNLTPETVINYDGDTYRMMPENLGAIWDSGHNIYYSPYYQWGRKDPLSPMVPGSGLSAQMSPLYDIDGASYSDYGVLGSSGDGSAQKTVSNAIRLPNKFFSQISYEGFNWSSLIYNVNHWNAAVSDYHDFGSNNTPVKTVYDPCPVGYMIPSGAAFTGFTSNGDDSSTSSQFNIVGTFNRGYRFKRISSDVTGSLFPVSGWLTESGTGQDLTTSANYWSFTTYTASHQPISPRSLYFREVIISPMSVSFYRSQGLYVRPCVNPTRLPGDYDAVEYLESTGNQFIHTWFKFTENKGRIVTEFCRTSASSSYAEKRLGGAYDGNRALSLYMGCDPVYIGAGGNDVATGISIGSSYVTADVSADNGTLNYTIAGVSGSTTYTGTIATSNNLAIFCSNENSFYNYYGSYRVKSYKIYNGTTLVRDYVPVVRRSDKKPGLYDKVNHNFMTNQFSGHGSKEFLHGPKTGEVF